MAAPTPTPPQNPPQRIIAGGLGPATLFEVAVYGSDAGADPWGILLLPKTLPVSEKDGRAVVAGPVTSGPLNFPTTGRIVVKLRGETVHEFGYQGCVPAVGPDPAAADTEADPEKRYPGYDALPAEKWCQLNQRSDSYVVQVKLRKATPSGAHFYRVERVAVTAPVRPADLKSDMEKALVI